MNLISERLDVDDYDEAVELFYQRNWTDGLPVVLPRRRRVEAMIAGAGRDPQESLGPVPPKGGAATVEKLAINAVMGGCLPAHFPVVLAALKALLTPLRLWAGSSSASSAPMPKCAGRHPPMTAHFPVVLAALEALLDPAHNLNGVTQTTHMCVPLVIVNGPIARVEAELAREGR